MRTPAASNGAGTEGSAVRKPRHVIAFEHNLDQIIADFVSDPRFDVARAQELGVELGKCLRGARGAEGIVAIATVMKLAIGDLESQADAGAVDARVN